MIKTVFLSLTLSLSCMAGSLTLLKEQPWLGYFAAYESRDFNFGVNADGEAFLIPLRNDKPISSKYWIKIEPVIEEVRPGGKVVTKQSLQDGWEPLTKSSNEAEKISYRGTVTGGAKYEIHFEMDRGKIMGGGKLLEKGELTEFPIRFSIRVRIPDVYAYVDDDEIEERAEDDDIRMVRGDGEKLKFDAWEPVWAEKEDVSGPGIKTARIELSGYKGAKIELESGDGGLFEFWNGKKQSLYKGFTMGWKPDPAKDTDGSARFVLEFD